MLLVAPLAPVDAEAALALMLHPLVARPLFPAPPQLTPASLLQRTYFVARLQRDGPLVGTLGLHHGRLAYAIDPALWGRGLGRELLAVACRTLAPAAGLTQLQALVQRDNVRSRRLLEHAGFRYVGPQETPCTVPAVLRFVYRLPPSPARPAAAGSPPLRETCHG